ncbi:hypothetical protein [Scytonema sp. NUACC26]|uniref:hypothetical protein n=1 Tax=Scytonema sp. NUACC26 TaxID=3140176 RepID=UPI0034DCB1F6
MTQTQNEGKLDPKQNAQSSLETNNSHSQEIAFSEKLSWDNTFNVEVVELGELREEELHLRLHLERKVERSFYEAGKALMELRDKRLYRNTHKTFEEYCRDRFGHSRQKSNYLIAAADIFENLTTIGYMHHNVHNVCLVRV